MRSDYRFLLHRLALLAIPLQLISGCTSNSFHTRNTEPSIEIKASPSNEVSWEDLPMPEVRENCGALEGLISKLDIDFYQENLERLKLSKIPAYYSQPWFGIVNAGMDEFEGTWDKVVLGPAVAKANLALQSQDAENLRNLERESRVEFLKFTDKIFRYMLSECELEKDYLERLSILQTGRLYVAQRVQSESAEIARQFPPVEVEAADLWKTWSGNQEYRWLQNCQQSFGACKSLEVRSDVGCDQIFVEANFSLNGRVVYSAIDSLRNLKANSVGKFTLVSTEIADSVSLQQISCY